MVIVIIYRFIGFDFSQSYYCVIYIRANVKIGSINQFMELNRNRNRLNISRVRKVLQTS
jgi:uncharacterized membrane protein YczE